MKKDAIYRLKNSENMPWRDLLLNVAKSFVKQVNLNKEVATNSAFILDDTTEKKRLEEESNKSRISMTMWRERRAANWALRT